MLKAVILIGGPQKGTRFRPLSFDMPKPLFPVAGFPMIQHLIEACCKVPNLREILMIGFYQLEHHLEQFISSVSKEQNVLIRYLQEYKALGTAGGIYHFRDQIRSGNPEAFFLINGDVCGDFPLEQMISFHKSKGPKALITLMGTEATRLQSLNYGCIVEHKETNEVLHYVEKPSTFVSTIINTGVYVCSLDIFQEIAAVFKQKNESLYNGEYINGDAGSKDCIRLEQDIITHLANTSQLYVFKSQLWWSHIKTSGSAIYANRHYLGLYNQMHKERLASSNKNCYGDVFIHPTAQVHPTAILGPNVSVGQGAVIGAGVRIRESIILGNSTIQDHALILYSIIGWNSTVGKWARVEGTPCDPNPNTPFAKMDNLPLFNTAGKLNPSITVLGCNVQVPPEVIVLNSIILPYKELNQSYKNEIIL